MGTRSSIKIQAPTAENYVQYKKALPVKSWFQVGSPSREIMFAIWAQEGSPSEILVSSWLKKEPPVKSWFQVWLGKAPSLQERLQVGPKKTILIIAATHWLCRVVSMRRIATQGLCPCPVLPLLCYAVAVSMPFGAHSLLCLVCRVCVCVHTLRWLCLVWSMPCPEFSLQRSSFCRRPVPALLCYVVFVSGAFMPSPDSSLPRTRCFFMLLVSASSLLQSGCVWLCRCPVLVPPLLCCAVVVFVCVDALSRLSLLFFATQWLCPCPITPLL